MSTSSSHHQRMLVSAKSRLTTPVYNLHFLRILSRFKLIMHFFPCHGRKKETIPATRDERPTPPITPFCNAATVGSPRRFSLSPSVLSFRASAHTPFMAPLSAVLLPSACTHDFLPPSMPKMPPAVRKCQTFTTHHPPYQACTLTQTRTKYKGIEFLHAQIYTDAHTHICPQLLDAQYNAGNPISQRVYSIDFYFSLVLVRSGLVQSSSR